MTAVSREVLITNKRGLHARASAKFVNLASELGTPIEVETDSNRICGTSIMGLMMLGEAMGDTIERQFGRATESEDELSR